MVSTTDQTEHISLPLETSAAAPMPDSPENTTIDDTAVVQPENHPLLNPIIAALLFEHLADDSKTVYHGMQVCRLWWSEGHKRLWRRARLSDLYTHVQDVKRRAYFSRYIKTVTLRPGDTTLASQQMALQPVALDRLKSVSMHETNLVNVYLANIQSLIVPSLRSLTMKADWVRGQPRQTDTESIIFLSALIPSCHTLTTLDFNIHGYDALEPLLRTLLTRLTAVEHLNIGDIVELLHMRMHGQDLLRMLFDKPRLATLTFPHAVDFTDDAVQVFLAGMRPYWSLPSLRELSRPVFFSSGAAAALLYRLPNLTYLELELEEFEEDWGDALEQAFDALSQLKQLKTLELRVHVRKCDLDGAWLVKLAQLKQLECLWLLCNHQPRVIFTGAQLAALLVGLPRLNNLILHLGTLEVLCSVDEKFIIDTAFARMKQLVIGNFIFITQHSV